MSYETPTEAIENYAASTNPYIRGFCDEICDHLLMLAEAYRPPTIKAGDLESKFPGYAKGAQQASEIFEAWFDDLGHAIDTLTKFETGLRIHPLPRGLESDQEPKTPGGIAREHTHYLVTTRDYPRRFGMTEEETRSLDVADCKQSMMEAAESYREMQYEARDLSRKYLGLLQEAGYNGDVFAEDVKSSLPDGVRRPQIEQTQEEDAISGGVDER